VGRQGCKVLEEEKKGLQQIARGTYVAGRTQKYQGTLSSAIILAVSGPLKHFLYDGYINELNMTPVSPVFWNSF